MTVAELKKELETLPDEAICFFTLWTAKGRQMYWFNPHGGKVYPGLNGGQYAEIAFTDDCLAYRIFENEDDSEKVILHKIGKNEMNEIKKGRFSLDGEKYFSGYTSGETWNGFECPMFPLSSARQIVKALRAEANFESDKPYYIPSMKAFAIDGDIVKAQTITYKGREITVYSIGAFAWVWQKE